MDIVFLDANVLFSAAYREDSGLLKLWDTEATIVTSDYAVEEAEKNLESTEQLERLKRLLKLTLIIKGYTPVALPEDLNLPEKDRPIFQAAIAAGATHLLTGDISHFGPYYGKKTAGIIILPPGEYPRLRR